MSTVSWNVDRLIERPLTDCKAIRYDGRDLWILYGTTILTINFWDQTTEYEGNYYEEYSPNLRRDETQHANAGPVDVSSAGTPNFLIKIYDKMYTVGDTHLLEIDIPSRTISNTYALPVAGSTINAAIGVSNKVWLIDKQTERDQIRYFDTTTSTWSSASTIPGTQDIPRKMAWSHHDSLYVVSYNDGLIHKYSTSDGTYQGDFYVNHLIKSVRGNNDQELQIGSYGGLISTWNETTDSLTHTLSASNIPVDLVDDGTYVWSITPALNRTTKGTNPNVVKFQDDDTLNRHIASFGENEFEEMEITPEFTYQYWDGTEFKNRTVKPYIILRRDDGVFIFRSAPLQRNNYLKVRATAMISTGTGFYGDS